MGRNLYIATINYASMYSGLLNLISPSTMTLEANAIGRAPSQLAEGRPGAQAATSCMGPGNISRWKLFFFQKFEFEKRGYFGTTKKNFKKKVTPGNNPGAQATTQATTRQHPGNTQATPRQHPGDAKGPCMWSQARSPGNSRLPSALVIGQIPLVG